MKRIIVTATLAIAAGAAWGQAPAAGEDDVAKARSFIKGLDKDGNGTLSRAETKGYPLDADFDRIDANHDGALDARELAEFKAQNPGAGGGQAGGGQGGGGQGGPPAGGAPQR